MKKLILLLLFPAALQAQNFGSVDYLCQAAAGKTLLLYRLPDSTNAIQTTTANSKGFYRFNMAAPGLYLVKYVNTGTDTVSVARFPFMPVVGIGGDSTSNAGRIIRNALDSLPSTGGIIYLPPGTHLLDSATVTMNKDNVRVVGTGDNCIIKAANSFNLYGFTGAAGVENVTFENFVYNGNKANQTAGGAFNFNGAGIGSNRWKNVKIRHTYDHGIVLANGASDNLISECTFDTIGVAGQTSVTTALPVYIVSGSHRNKIEKCKFNWWSGVAAVRINNNCDRNEVLSSFFRSNDRTGTADRRGIFADSGADGACDYLKFVGNDFFDIDENAIFSDKNTHTLIEGNTIDSVGTAADVTGNGIECNDDFSAVNDNDISRAKKHGISLNNTIQTEANDNRVSLCYGRGIYFFAASGDSVVAAHASGNTIWNNNADGVGTEAGLEAQGQDAGTDGLLRGVNFTANTSVDTRNPKKQNYGISVAAATGFAKGICVIGNNVGRNLTGAINDGSDGTDVIANNQTTDE